MAEHNDLGEKGEEIATEFLRKAGYLILDRNWVWQKAELDIVAFHANQLVIAEVKTRALEHYTDTDDLISNKKLRLLYDAAGRYTEIKNIVWEVRYDLIVVIFHGDTWTIEHTPDAFYPFMNL
ncbi:MAG: YraN family protein [Bacteroidota bacterium]|nr:YraN family protein [Bacteroidota bacterium]